MSLIDSGINAFVSGANAASEGGLRMAQENLQNQMAAKQAQEIQASKVLMDARQQAVQGASGLSMMPDISSLTQGGTAGAGGDAVPTAAMTATQADSAVGTPGYGASAASGYSPQGLPGTSSSGTAAPSASDMTSAGTSSMSGSAPGMTSPEQATLNSKFANYTLIMNNPSSTATDIRNAEDDVRGYRYRTAMRVAQQYLLDNPDKVDHILGGMMHASTTSGRGPIQIVKGVSPKTNQPTYTITIDGKTDKLTPFEAAHLAASMVTHGVDPELAGTEIDNTSKLVGARMGVLTKDHLDAQKEIAGRQNADASTLSAQARMVDAATQKNRLDFDMTRPIIRTEYGTDTDPMTQKPTRVPFTVLTNPQNGVVTILGMDGKPIDQNSPRGQRLLQGTNPNNSDTQHAAIAANFREMRKTLGGQIGASTKASATGTSPMSELDAQEQSAHEQVDRNAGVAKIRNMAPDEQQAAAQQVIQQALAASNKIPSPTELITLGFTGPVVVRALQQAKEKPPAPMKQIPVIAAPVVPDPDAALKQQSDRESSELARLDGTRTQYSPEVAAYRARAAVAADAGAQASSDAQKAALFRRAQAARGL